MNKTRILVVDDDAAILRFLSANLKARGYEVSLAVDGEQALEVIDRENIDLIMLDVMMPKLDGVEVCRRVREWSAVPILVLSARGEEKDKVRCLELGADDYLTKPFGIAELLARVQAALRRSGLATAPPARSNLVCDGMEVNFAKRKVMVAGSEVKLTPTEFSLLQLLATNSDKVLTHTMLLQKVWGPEYATEKEYLRVFVGRLRKKIESDPENPRYILTIPGVGYHFSGVN